MFSPFQYVDKEAFEMLTRHIENVMHTSTPSLEVTDYFVHNKLVAKHVVTKDISAYTPDLHSYSARLNIEAMLYG